MQETRDLRVPSLGQEDLLEEKMATHSDILAWRMPWMVEPGRLQSMGSQICHAASIIPNGKRLHQISNRKVPLLHRRKKKTLHPMIAQPIRDCSSKANENPLYSGLPASSNGLSGYHSNHSQISTPASPIKASSPSSKKAGYSFLFSGLAYGLP